MMIYELVFDDGESRRLDIFVAEKTEVTRSYAASLIADGNVLVNGKIAAKNTKLKNELIGKKKKMN